MTVTCPNCKTTYNLADDKARPGVKLRCTVCKQVFPLPAPPVLDGAGALGGASGPSSGMLGEDLHIDMGSGQKKGKKSKIIFVLLFFVVVFGGIGATLQLTPWLDPVKAMLRRTPPPSEAIDAELAAKLAKQLSQLAMRNVRQYTIVNEKLGKLTVVEGQVVNGSDEPRELIRVEAILFDDKGNVSMSKSQLAGTVISLFQLQVLNKDELEGALNNKLDILSNNTNIPPGGQVPFMIVLYGSPENAKEFSIRITDARIPTATP